MFSFSFIENVILSRCLLPQPVSVKEYEDVLYIYEAVSTKQCPDQLQFEYKRNKADEMGINNIKFIIKLKNLIYLYKL